MILTYMATHSKGLARRVRRVRANARARGTRARTAAWRRGAAHCLTGRDDGDINPTAAQPAPRKGLRPPRAVSTGADAPVRQRSRQCPAGQSSSAISGSCPAAPSSCAHCARNLALRHLPPLPPRRVPFVDEGAGGDQLGTHRTTLGSTKEKAATPLADDR
jgi:hypothetical protein